MIFLVFSLPIYGQNTIKTLEYWIDGNSSARVLRNLTPQNTYNWEEIIDFSTITDGVHTANVRFCDNQGIWTSVQSHFFLKKTNSSGVGVTKKITALECWIDGNFSEKTQRNLTAQNTYNWEEIIDFSTASDGVHSANVRFKDDFGVWTSVQSRFFLKRTNAVGEGEVKKITALEYWMDGNSSEKIQRNLTAQNTYNWEEIIDFSTASDGVHSANVRFKDEFGVWTSVQSQFFLKRTNAVGEGEVKKITTLECWIDGKTSEKIHRILTAQNTYNWEEIIDFSTASDGVHSANVRFKDEFGVWTSVQSQFFLKRTNAVGEGEIKKIIALEYWIDGKSSEKIQRNLTAQNTYNWEELMDFSTASDGVHSANVRFKDEFGVWTNVQSQFFFKNEKQIILAGENKITAYRLWYSEEPTFVHNIAIASPDKTVDLNDSTVINYLPKGKHQIAYQLKDLRGIWSPVITDSITKSDNPIFSFLADKREIMQHQSVKFTPSTQLFIDSIVWNFGDGITEVNFEPEHKFDSIGNFDVSATVWHRGTNEGVSYIEIKYINVISTGIFSPKVYSLKMYPVPVQNELTIESSEAQMKSVRVISLNGTILKEVNANSPEKTSISLNNLNSGSYIIVVNTDKGLMSNKILKK